MKNYPEYPTIGDSNLRERAEDCGEVNFKHAKYIWYLAREVELNEENAFFMSELKDMGLKLIRVSPKGEYNTPD